MVPSAWLAKLAVGAAFFLRSVLAAPLDGRGGSLPIVDLGYTIQRASSFNETGRFYNFTNIRYGAPPVGNLRFRRPKPPTPDRSVVRDGSEGSYCPQAGPAWLSVAQDFIVYRLLGMPYTPPNSTSDGGAGSDPTLPPGMSEDCLFLDVFVPDHIFNKPKACGDSGPGAPVVVWIYGGGFVGGQKDGIKPSGFLERSENAPTTGGVVFVALNYRLGAFGWLSGEEVKKDGDANAGLWDQRLALEWVKMYIHLFGGDPNRVTVMGESAGGGSIMHQITAFGGHGKLPFQQAIPQSPGWNPAISPSQQEQTFQQFLQLAGVSSLAEARQAPTEALMKANLLQVGGASYGQFVYGPVTDGTFVPAQPAQLLASGSFDKSVKVMVGHNANESVLFTPPTITTDAAFVDYIRTSFPETSPSIVDYVTTVLYPPIYDGSQGYTDVLGRAIKSVSEFVFTCNTFFLDVAYGNETHAYFFDIPPALHGQDVPYTFFTGNAQTPNANYSPFNPFAITNVTVAIGLQEYLTSFAQTGAPVAVPGLPEFPKYGKDATIVVLKQNGVELGVDDTANERCRWWQKGLYLSN